MASTGDSNMQHLVYNVRRFIFYVYPHGVMYTGLSFAGTRMRVVQN